jgi:hypothetical protein
MFSLKNRRLTMQSEAEKIKAKCNHNNFRFISLLFIYSASEMFPKHFYPARRAFVHCGIEGFARGEEGKRLGKLTDCLRFIGQSVMAKPRCFPQFSLIPQPRHNSACVLSQQTNNLRGQREDKRLS